MANDFRESVRERVRRIPSGPVPAPWRPVEPITIGGLTEVGIGRAPSGEEFVLVVSGSGRGIVSADGEIVARDRTEQVEDWHDPTGLTAAGIGPLAGMRVPVAGLAGGGLPVTTTDRWSVGRYPVDWPEERVILEPPDAGVLWRGHEAGCVTLLGPDAVFEVRAAGFAPSGRLLVIATTGDITLYTR